MASEVATEVLRVLRKDLPAHIAVVAASEQGSRQCHFTERFTPGLHGVGSAGASLIGLACIFHGVGYIAGHAGLGEQGRQGLGRFAIADQFESQADGAMVGEGAPITSLGPHAKRPETVVVGEIVKIQPRLRS